MKTSIHTYQHSGGNESEGSSKLKPANPDANIVALIDALQSIDENGKLAKLNATSIADNNGSRIHL